MDVQSGNKRTFILRTAIGDKRRYCQLANILNIYFNALNLLNDDSPKLDHTDKISATYKSGVNLIFQ